MAAPVIGISVGVVKDSEGNPRHSIGEVYVTAVLRAGGIPLLIPTGLSGDQLDVVRSRVDAVLVTGGPDVEPTLFNGEPHPAIYGVDSRRDTLEINLVRAAVKEGMPLLGICRGIQVINVALGGDLYTHIADQLPGALKHDCYPGFEHNYEAHPVEIEAGSLLEKIVETRQVPVNSLHHQGLRQAAPGTRAIAFAPDGLIESIEIEGHPFGLGVQWHPEWMPEAPKMQAIFRALVNAARK